jgi:hypothetical protein
MGISAGQIALFFAGPDHAQSPGGAVCAAFGDDSIAKDVLSVHKTLETLG